MEHHDGAMGRAVFVAFALEITNVLIVSRSLNTCMQPEGSGSVRRVQYVRVSVVKAAGNILNLHVRNSRQMDVPRGGAATKTAVRTQLELSDCLHILASQHPKVRTP